MGFQDIDALASTQVHLGQRSIVELVDRTPIEQDDSWVKQRPFDQKASLVTDTSEKYWMTSACDGGDRRDEAYGVGHVYVVDHDEVQRLERRSAGHFAVARALADGRVFAEMKLIGSIELAMRLARIASRRHLCSSSPCSLPSLPKREVSDRQMEYLYWKGTPFCVLPFAPRLAFSFS